MFDGREPRTESILCHIDEISVAAGEPTTSGSLPQGALTSVRGWFLSREHGDALSRVTTRIGDGLPVDAHWEFRRQDVTAAFEWASPYCGFYAVLPIDSGQGTQTVTVSAYATDRTIRTASPCQVEVSGALDPLAGLSERPDGWAVSIDGFFSSDGHLHSFVRGSKASIIPYERPALLKVWIVDVKSRRPPTAVLALLGGSYLPVYGPSDRNDAALHVGIPSAALCGFTIPVIPPWAGTATVRLFALSVDGTYLRIPPITVRQENALRADALPDGDTVRGNIDEIRVGDFVSESHERVVVPRGTLVQIRGWAVDTLGPRLSGGVEAVIDGAEIVAALSGRLRPEIALDFGNTALADCEFLCSFDTVDWRRGAHSIALRAFSSRGDRIQRFGQIMLVVR
jgi:hypothetical protein